MSIIKRFVEYWSETLKGAQKTHELIGKIVIIVSAILAGLGYSKNWNIYMNAISTAIFVVLILRAIFWLPVLKHEAQEKEYAKQLASKDSLFVSIDEKLKLTIEEHTNTKAKDLERQINKQLLGSLLVTLRNRRTELRGVLPYSYEDKVRTDEEFKSTELIKQTIDYLHKNIGGDAAALFQCAKPVQYPDTDPYVSMFSDRKRQYWHHLGQLEGYENALKTIIEKQL